MTPDRVADIPVRHLFINYVCTISYSECQDAFTLIGTRYADPSQSKLPKNQHLLYLRILKEPTLRATLLETLVPDAKAQITELRETAVSRKGKSLGLTVGFVALGLTAYLLYRSSFWLSRHSEYEWAEMVIYIAAFFAFFIVFPVQSVVERWYARRYCHSHSHRITMFKGANGAIVTSCKRCGLNFSTAN